MLSVILPILLFLCPCLWAENATVQYELFLERNYEIEQSLYVATPTGVHFGLDDENPYPDRAGESIEISMDRAYTDPQILIAFRNNLQSPGNIKIRVTFRPFTRTDGVAFTGGYVACMCRYKLTTIGVDANNDGINDYSYSYYEADENLGSFRLDSSDNLVMNGNKYWDKNAVVTTGNKTMNWGVNATARGAIARTWYYAISFVFEGTVTSLGTYDFKSDYPDDVSFQSTMTVELIGT